MMINTKWQIILAISSLIAVQLIDSRGRPDHENGIGSNRQPTVRQSNFQSLTRSNKRNLPTKLSTTFAKENHGSQAPTKNVLANPNKIHQSEKLQHDGVLKGKIGSKQQPTKSAVARPKPASKGQQGTTKNEKLQKVEIEVERLFDSFSKRRSEIERPEDSNGDEMTVVIENDGETGDDDDSSRDQRDNLPNASEQPGFAIVLDNTDENSNIATPKNTADDFAKMSLEYDRMSKRFERYLMEEKSHIPRQSSPTVSLRHSAPSIKRETTSHSTPAKATQAQRRHDVPRSTVEANIENLKRVRENLQHQSEALDAAEQGDVKEDRSSISRDGAKVDQTKLPYANPAPTAKRDKMQNKSENTSRNGARPLDQNGAAGGAKESSRVNTGEEETDKAVGGNQKDGKGVIGISKGMSDHPTGRAGEEDGIKRGRSNVNQNQPTKDDRKYHPTFTLRNSKTYHASTMPATARNTASSSNKTAEDGKKQSGDRVVHPRKAGAMIEYLNKDPLESWFYKYQSLQALGLNSTMLRNGLVNAGSIDRLKNAMERALKGEDITLSIVGGSISAGGGLYKDEGSIAGLYYKGVVDWWNKVITPLTGSEMKVNNVAIGSIGTDYFSFCLRSHVWNDSNIIIWELSGNDYNRYLKTPTKGAKPLERLSRMALQLPRDPAIIYVNFFKGVDYKKAKKNCPNFEDQGEDIIAHYYKIPSLSWRAMVCESLIDQNPLFTLKTLFCKDQYHPSLLAHAQMALLLILHLRHVMRSVLQYANAHDGFLPNFASFYNLPAPLFVGLETPSPLCWTLITPDFKESISNTLGVKVLDENGFKLEYATNFPIRFDRVICWKAEKVGGLMKIQIALPEATNTKQQRTKLKYEIAITTHTRFGGKAEVWLDQRPDNPMIIQEGRPNDTGKRTQVDQITQSAEPGVHTLNFKAIKEGFCLASIMIS